MGRIMHAMEQLAETALLRPVSLPSSLSGGNQYSFRIFLFEASKTANSLRRYGSTFCHFSGLNDKDSDLSCQKNRSGLFSERIPKACFKPNYNTAAIFRIFSSISRREESLRAVCMLYFD